MSYEDTKIPACEMENVLSVYWQLLSRVESMITDKSCLDKLLVSDAYTLLNRIGATSERPRFEKE